MSFFENPRLVLDVFLIVWQTALTGVIWLRRPGEEAQESVKQLAEALGKKNQALEQELILLKQRVDNMPTNADLSDLTGMVKVIEAQNEAQNQSVDAMRHQLNRIESFLLTHSNRN